ncbi:hypothetical protein ES705_10685 [subsurface metagenome]
MEKQKRKDLNTAQDSQTTINLPDGSRNGWLPVHPEFNYVDTAVNGWGNRNNPRSLPVSFSREDRDSGYTLFRFNKEYINHYNTNRNDKGENSVSDFKGKCYTDSIKLDIDIPHDLPRALKTVQDFACWFSQEYDVPMDTIFIWFSGSKGFSVELPISLFGEVVPTEDLPERLKAFAQSLGDDWAFDTDIYDINRLWRAENTINSKSGLYKIRIRDILGTTLDEIKEAAKSPGEATSLEEYYDWHPVPVLVELFNQTNGQSNGSDEMVKKTSGKTFAMAAEMLETGVPEGHRRNAAFEIARHFKYQGMRKDFVGVLLGTWNGLNRPPLSEDELDDVVDKVFSGIGSNDIFEQQGRLYKRIKLKKSSYDKKLTEWSIDPKELIDLGSRDVLRCDITSANKEVYRDSHVENEAWLSKQKLLKALGRSDLNVYANETEIQEIAHYVMERVPLRSRGTDCIGLTDNTFVSEGINITSDEISLDPRIKVYIRGDESLVSRVRIRPPEDESAFVGFLQNLYRDLPLINKPGVIHPVIAWLCLVPLKSRIKDLRGGFFILHVYGEQGSGKTSTAELGMLMYGFLDPTVFDCRMTSFAMLALLASTNGLPIPLDEYKESNMLSWQVNQIKDRIRGLYRGSVEMRGHADQTTSNYKLLAPVALMGEYKISEPAIMERVILAPFGRDIKTDKSFTHHYHSLRALPLEHFAAGYIQWALGQDLEDYYAKAQKYLERRPDFHNLPPRVRENWLALHCGLQLWQGFGEYHGIQVASIPYKQIFDTQAEELGLSETGNPKRDVDRVIEYMATLVEKGEVSEGIEWSGGYPGHILISVRPMLDALRKYKKQTDSDVYVMDDSSFRYQIKQSSYYVNFERASIGGVQRRCLWLSYDKMTDEGLEVEGFKNPPSPKEWIY